MSMSLITLLVGIGLSAVALISTPLAARVTHTMPDPEAGYFSTTLMALLITAAYGGGAISSIMWFAELGKTAAWVLVPAYLIAMIVLGRVVWKILGPRETTVAAVPVTGIQPLGA